MNSFHPARRNFLQLLGGTASAAWLTANWPVLLSAAEHAHQAAKGKQPTAFEVLTADQAREVEALSACIIPSDETPGAREAGVVYFIDRALKTFFSDSLPVYQKGLDAVQKTTAELFPGVHSFSAATEEQKTRIFTQLAAESTRQKDGLGLAPGASTNFFETLRMHTIFGFLVDPEGGGNRDFVGWKAIGRDPAHSFSPPFGFYDKDYPGWQPAPAETEKK